MSARLVVPLALSAILFGSATSGLPSDATLLTASILNPAPAKKISEGEIYKSPGHHFTVVVPKPTGFDHSGWEVSYESKPGDHEAVTFAMYRFAQTYKAGIAGAVDLDAIAKNAAVSRTHQVGLPLESLEESKVDTQFGEGSLRVYSIKGGSLDKSGHGSEKPGFHDSYIAVLLVPQQDRTFFAVAQDDNYGFIRKASAETWIKSLKDEVQSFFATMTLGK